MSILLFLFFGLVVGAIARFLVAGHEPGGWITSIVIGIAGSFVGAFIGRTAGFYRDGETSGFVMSVLGAVLVTGLYHLVAGRRATA